MDIDIINNKQNYSDLYDFSTSDPLKFWDQCASKYLDWFSNFEQVYSGNINNFQNLSDIDFKPKWFAGGKLNACYNCLDRFLEDTDKANKIAYYWQGDHLEQTQQITYQELYNKVCIFSNVLKNSGIKKGDRVCIYLPICIEAITAMLACARIGAVHTVVFAGFSPQALSERILDAECKLLITTDISKRGGKLIPIWDNAKQSVELVINKTDATNHLKSVLLIPDYYSNISDYTNIFNTTDFSSNNINLYDYNTISKTVNNICEPQWMDSHDPLFILYTSGSTGKPKGVLHSTAGYLLHCLYSFKQILDIKPDDIYWCSADIGWVAGHSYVVYGALLNNTSSVIFSGTPNYPDHDIFWKIIDKYQVSIFYTAPTAIRALMKEGNKYLASTTRDSLRVLATVGEPINPEAWQWYYQEVGNKRCPVIDTWWQTETGAAMLSPYVNIDIQKPGCACLPFMGVRLAILDAEHNEIPEHLSGQGNLVIKSPWPGMMQTVYNNHDKFIETYYKPYPNYFYTGDLAKRDQDGHYWILGRSDDVINIAGHRLGTAEIESALASHDLVAEAAVIAVPDDIKGQALYSFVVLNNSYNKQSIDNITQDLKNHVKKSIGPIAIIKTIKLVPGLPKTRSGKIMRRILKLIAVDSTDFGDTSTLTNPEILQELI